MTSRAKVEANRRNAQASTGPRTKLGKARSRYNAYRHGLSIPSHSNPEISEGIETLARELLPPVPLESDYQAARAAAEAQIEIMRVRRLRLAIMAPVVQARGESVEIEAGAAQENIAALAFARAAPLSAAVDRYEQRALSKRKRALGILARRTKTPKERVGPQLPPRTKDNPFNRHAIAFNLGDIDKVTANLGVGQPARWDLDISSSKLERATATVILSDAGHGTLVIELQFDGLPPIANVWEIAAQKSGLGSTRWMAICPESGKRVQALYLVEGRHQFRSRYAWRLHYRSSRRDPTTRAFSNAIKIMERIGARHMDDCPDRPKYMSRKLFVRLRESLVQERNKFYASIGKHLPDEDEEVDTPAS